MPTPTSNAMLPDHPSHLRVAWGAVIAGALIIVVSLIAISQFFIGIGLYSFDPLTENPSASGLAMKTAIGWILASLIATFLGAWVAGVLVRPVMAGVGALHGILAWALSLVVVGLLVTTALGVVVGGAFSVLARGVGGLAQGGGQGLAQAAQGVDWSNVRDEMRTAMNRAGAAPAGATPAGSGDANAAAAGNAGRAGAGGDAMAMVERVLRAGDQAAGGERERAIDAIAAATGGSREEAARRMQEWQAGYEQAEQRARVAADNARRTLAQAAIWSFVAMLVGVVIAAGGGAFGGRADRTREAHRRDPVHAPGSLHPEGPRL